MVERDKVEIETQILPLQLTDCVTFVKSQTGLKKIDTMNSLSCLHLFSPGRRKSDQIVPKDPQP